MKKIFYASILVFAILISFGLGTVFANKKNNKNDLIGVYQTDSWNGKVGTLVLYEDGTCQYPTRDSGNWTADEQIVYITLKNGDNTFVHEAKIMENGLVLHEAFFKKVSN